MKYLVVPLQNTTPLNTIRRGRCGRHADTPQARPNRAVLWLLGADGIQASQATPDGVTPPFIACQNGHVDVVRALLGADGIQANQANL